MSRKSIQQKSMTQKRHEMKSWDEIYYPKDPLYRQQRQPQKEYNLAARQNYKRQNITFPYFTYCLHFDMIPVWVSVRG